jgi:hypothetical protein
VQECMSAGVQECMSPIGIHGVACVDASRHPITSDPNARRSGGVHTCTGVATMNCVGPLKALPPGIVRLWSRRAANHELCHTPAE